MERFSERARRVVEVAHEKVRQLDHPYVGTEHLLLGEPPFSPRARRAIDRASRLSLQRRDAHVDPEHLLIGVLDVEGRAGQVLRGLGVDVAALRLAIDLPRENLRGDDEPVAVPVRGAAPVPRCAACGTGLKDPGLAYRIIAAEDEHGHQRSFAVTSCSACGAVFGTSPV